MCFLSYVYLLAMCNLFFLCLFGSVDVPLPWLAKVLWPIQKKIHVLHWKLQFIAFNINIFLLIPQALWISTMTTTAQFSRFVSNWWSLQSRSTLTATNNIHKTIVHHSSLTLIIYDDLFVIASCFLCVCRELRSCRNILVMKSRFKCLAAPGWRELSLSTVFVL